MRSADRWLGDDDGDVVRLDEGQQQAEQRRAAGGAAALQRPHRRRSSGVEVGVQFGRLGVGLIELQPHLY